MTSKPYDTAKHQRRTQWRTTAIDVIGDGGRSKTIADVTSKPCVARAKHMEIHLCHALGKRLTYGLIKLLST